MRIFSYINSEKNLKNYTLPKFCAKGISPDIRESLIKLSPEKRYKVLQEFSEKLPFHIPVSSWISFLRLENYCINYIEKKEIYTVSNSKKISDYCYKKGNVTVSKKFYESGNGINTPIEKKELDNIFEFLDNNILNNPKLEKFDISLIIHMPFEKIIMRYKEKNSKEDSSDFIQGTYKNNVIDINLDKLLIL